MTQLRALVLLLAISFGVATGSVVQSRVAVASAPLATEDAATQARTLAEAYNLLLDHYVHPVDTAAMLRAGWDNLAKEASPKAATPGPAPLLSGDRAGDLQAMRTALSAYLEKPNSAPDGFVPPHALIREMARVV